MSEDFWKALAIVSIGLLLVETTFIVAFFAYAANESQKWKTEETICKRDICKIQEVKTNAYDYRQATGECGCFEMGELVSVTTVRK